MSAPSTASRTQVVITAIASTAIHSSAYVTLASTGEVIGFTTTAEHDLWQYFPLNPETPATICATARACVEVAGLDVVEERTDVG